MRCNADSLKLLSLVLKERFSVITGVSLIGINTYNNRFCVKWSAFNEFEVDYLWQDRRGDWIKVSHGVKCNLFIQILLTWYR